MFSGSLRAFDETVRTGSIRKASEVLRVAPSSVSRHIAILERQMGTALFYRRAGGLELTHAGSLVAAYARSVLVDYDTLRTDLDDIRGTQRRLVKLALVESVASYGPISAVGTFLQKFPTVSFSILLMPAPRVLEAVRQDQCDVGLAFCVEPDPEILTLASLREPIVLLVPAKHALATAKQVELKELKGLNLALPDADFGVRQIFDKACAASGLYFPPVLSSNVFETLRDFVRCGAGVAVLPQRAVARQERSGEFKAVPLAGAAFRDTHIDLIVLRSRRLSRVLKTFIDALIKEISVEP
jgi:DNA-binding transcriptional LysR family regulator